MAIDILDGYVARKPGEECHARRMTTAPTWSSMHLASGCDEVESNAP
jgi:hypothetical protein